MVFYNDISYINLSLKQKVKGLAFKPGQALYFFLLKIFLIINTIIAKNIITSPNINKKPNPQLPIKNVAINNINMVIINKIIYIILLSIKENDFFAIKIKETLFEPLAFV